MKKITRIQFHYRSDVAKTVAWEKKISNWLKKNHPSVQIVSEKPEAVIAMGGDGTIIGAARTFKKTNPLIIGLNLGHLGFLATVRKPNKFLQGLDLVLKGKYQVNKRMMLKVQAKRRGKVVYQGSALNDVIVQNPLGMVEIEADINNHPFQYIKGSGVLISSATGSTAYNLAAGGPIVMPNIQGMILTELLDHNLPTPSLVIKYTETIQLKVKYFRKKGELILTSTGEPADVLLIVDGYPALSVKKGDLIEISKSPKLLKFAEIEKNYFFKSLEKQFAFK